MLADRRGETAEAGTLPAEPRGIQIASTPDGVREALVAMRLRWNELPLDTDFCERAELILAEVLNNVVEHAYEGRDDGTIEVRFGPALGGAAFVVVDHGVAMPGEALPDGDLPQFGSEVASLPEGGFGWFLIRALVQDLRYKRIAGANHLSFWLPASG